MFQFSFSLEPDFDYFIEEKSIFKLAVSSQLCFLFISCEWPSFPFSKESASLDTTMSSNLSHSFVC